MRDGGTKLDPEQLRQAEIICDAPKSCDVGDPESNLPLDDTEMLRGIVATIHGAPQVPARLVSHLGG